MQFGSQPSVTKCIPTWEMADRSWSRRAPSKNDLPGLSVLWPVDMSQKLRHQSHSYCALPTVAQESHENELPAWASAWPTKSWSDTGNRRHNSILFSRDSQALCNIKGTLRTCMLIARRVSPVSLLVALMGCTTFCMAIAVPW